MTWSVESLVLIAVLLVLLAAGQWIAFALGVAGVIGMYLHSGSGVFRALGALGWNTLNDFVLTSVPLFILMGELILRSGLSRHFYRGVALWLGRLPGGLLHSNILACGIFAAVSGSSVATAAAIGTVAIPELEERGYDNSMVFGSLAAGGTLGILIPPSIPLILYGAMVEESVARLFMAGVIPGIVMMSTFMAYTALRVGLQRGLAPVETGTVTWAERWRGLLGVLPIFVLIAVILGGIYSGVMTPTEAAAIGVLVALLIAAAYRSLTVANLVASLVNTVKTSCMVLFIILGAQIFSFALVNAGINRRLTEWVVAMHLTPPVLFVMICILYVILGCLIDGISMMLLTLPVLYPIVLAAGFNPIWFGIILVILIELGQITPPVGLNLFVIHGMAGGRPLSTVVRGAFPYMLLMVLVLATVTAFPQLVLWLPQQMK